MKAYVSKQELKDEIKKTYTKYISEFDNIPEEMKDLRADDVDRTPAENLAFQVINKKRLVVSITICWFILFFI